MFKRTCIICSRDFKVKYSCHKTRTCSKYCAKKLTWQNRQPTKVKRIKCKNCGKIFTRPISFLRQHPTTTFCSRACFLENITITKRCLICGEKVKTTRNDYCSHKCSDIGRHRVKPNEIGIKKYCPKCGEKLDMSAFDKNKNKKDEHTDYCKKCQVKYLKEYFSKNKEKLAPKARLRCAQRRALLRGCKEKFTFEEWTNLCNKYSNICLACGQKKPLTVDHIIPLSRNGENGISNIQPLCRSCNISKGTKIINYERQKKLSIFRNLI